MQKKEYVRNMFAGISKRYDLLNHLLSLGRDRHWRKIAVSELKFNGKKDSRILDICAGTGDISLEIVRQQPGVTVVAADFCDEMLDIGRQKAKEKRVKDIEFFREDAENLTFADDTFNGAIVAFGIRNVPDVTRALNEMRRVVKPGSRIVVLEFSKPKNRLFKSIYYFYFLKILPLIGKAVSGKDGAYSYLPSSVMAFPDGKDFLNLMEKVGLRNTGSRNLTSGIVTVYFGEK